MVLRPEVRRAKRAEAKEKLPQQGIHKRGPGKPPRGKDWDSSSSAYVAKANTYSRPTKVRTKRAAAEDGPKLLRQLTSVRLKKGQKQLFTERVEQARQALSVERVQGELLLKQLLYTCRVDGRGILKWKEVKARSSSSAAQSRLASARASARVTFGRSGEWRQCRLL